jgi:gamma-glutamyltranspeptidase/glutathione hydrolase
MTVSRAAAAASEPHAAQAARGALAQGNAVDAVVAAVLVAAAQTPSVLLGPLQALVGGAGAGLLAVDGRVRQPGLGAPRPRGVVAGDPVPPQARVGVPALPAALATLSASLGRTALRRVAGAAVEWARAEAPERAAVLEALGRRGAAVLLDEATAGELEAAAGRAAGGALTRDDLAAVRPALVACAERSLDSGGILRAPWRDAAGSGASTHVVAAADARGLVAIACYEAPVEGLAIPALGLVAPAVASPVLRGQTRVRPGQPRPAASPIALRVDKGTIDLALGVGQGERAETSLEGVLAKLDEALPWKDALSAAEGRPVVVVWTREGARAMASA